MKYRKVLFGIALVTVSSVLLAQSSGSSSMFIDTDGNSSGGSHAMVSPAPASPNTSTRPFSKLAFGAGLSPLGIQLSMTTNLNAHLNVRASGYIFNYATNFTTNGIGANAKLGLESAGSALDIYPFHKGFRISPGVLFYNTDQISAAASVAGGTSFTLNKQTYYSANANAVTGATPVNGNALLNLHTNNPAFTITTGWGNTTPSKGHWSFPFEIGAAFIGAPSLKVNLGGWACYDQAQTMCTDISSPTNPIAQEIQGNLAAQVTKWNKDIEPLKTYPLASFGVAYSFGLRNK